MKVKVIKKFIDAHSKKVHAVGDELEITDARFKEICKVGKFVEVVEEQEAADDTDAETADEASASAASTTTTKKTTKKKGSGE